MMDRRDKVLETGVFGLDDVLRGGFPANHLYLVEGSPGSGKTTLALQFLLAGASRGERVMFVALSETKDELIESAASHGWSLEGVDIIEISSTESGLTAEARYTMYHPSEIELSEATQKILSHVDQVMPSRVVFDSLSEFRLLSETPVRYRRHILAMKHFFSRRQSTVLLTDDMSEGRVDMHVHSIAHGVIQLDRLAAEYGSMRRRLQVGKLRGVPFREGYHDVVIRRGGLQVFPRLVASEHRSRARLENVSTGLTSLDTLLGGGLSRGTSTLILGAAGTGKSSVAMFVATEAAKRGESAAIYLFDESIATLLERSAGLGLDMTGWETGALLVRAIDPAELSPGEFAHLVRQDVEAGARVIVIDSLTGYLNAMPSERFLTLHLHELLTYLGQLGVTTMLLMTQHGIVGPDMEVNVDASYLADTVILLRYFEAGGEIRQALSVVKKRTGRHERMIRELTFDGGVHLGEPLRDFEGVLTGTPRRASKTRDA